MANPSVVIDIATEFTGKKAFDRATKSTFNLEKSVKKLAGTFGLAFGATAVVNFSKQAVKAFATDEAAANRLSRAVDNLGIGFANPAIAKYISELERTAAVADDILRPAFQALLTTTGSLTKSQELLNNAITISRASGIDLATVSQDLANGYVGITKGLKKYNTGLTTAELSSKSFAEVLGVMLTRSAGAATDYLGTTQYKMDALTIATGNASEIIGGGLVNAFARIGGGTEASDAAKAIEDIAKAVAFTTETIGGLIGVIPSLLATLKKLPKDIFQGFAGAQVGKKLTPNPTVVKKTPAQISTEKQAKVLAKLESDAAKRQKAILALQKKQSDAAKKAAADQAKLTKAQSIFDLEKIQIEAALKGRISADEKLRLELQRAILNEDFELADKLQKRLEASQRATAALQGSLAAIKPVPSPFDEWIKSLKEISDSLSKILGFKVNTSSSMLNPNQPIVATQTPNSPFQEGTTPLTVTTVADLADAATTAAEMATLAANEAAALAVDAATFASTFAAGAAAAGAAMITANNIHPILPYTGSSSSIFNPYGMSSNIAGWGTNTSTVQDTPSMPPIVVNIEGMIDMDNIEGVFNQAMLNAIRKGLPQTIAGQLP
jgi:hypothetical protein